MELEGISVEALTDPTLYRRPAEEEEAEQTAKSFLESKQNRTSTLRDVHIKSKPKRSKQQMNDFLYQRKSFFLQ